MLLNQLPSQVTAGSIFGLALFGAVPHGLAQPVNDDFANRISLVGEAIVLTHVSTAHATDEPGEPNLNITRHQPSVWYSWTAPTDGLISLFYTGDDYSRYFGVFQGDRLESLRQVCPVNTSAEFVCRAGQTCQIQVMAPATTPAFDVHLQFTARPSNDQFSNRVALEGTLVTADGSTRAATREPREPRHNEVSFGQSVWYSWKAPASGYARLDVVGYLAPLLSKVYVGDSLKDLREAPGPVIDDFPLRGVFYADAGMDYKIAVDGDVEQKRVVHNGPFTLNLDFNTLTLLSPTNGADFLGPPEIELIVADLAPDLDGIPTEITLFAQDLLTGQTNTLGAISGSSGTLVWASPPLGYFLLQARATNTQGRLLESNPAGVVIRPSNDNFGNRIALEGTNSTWIGNFAGATRASGDPRVAQSLRDHVNGATLWWTWTAPVDGTVTLTCDSPSVAFAAFSGEEPGRHRTVLSPKSGSGQFEAVAGQTFEILLSDRSLPLAPSPTNAGPAVPQVFQAHLELAARPPNDNFTNCIRLEGTQVATNGATRGATREFREPRHNRSSFGRSVWYSWTAPASGSVRLDVSGEQVSLLSQVYVGDMLENLQTVPPLQTEDSPLPGVFFVEAGVDYRIAVDGDVLQGRVVNNGSFTLDLVFSGLILVSPTNKTDFVGPSEIELAVADLAPDLDGSLTGITFFAINQMTGEESALGIITSSTGSLTWTNPPAGRFVLYAQGTNVYGRTITSNPVGVAIRPSNDDFTNRIMLEGTNLTWDADFTGATRDTRDPRVPGILHEKPSGASLWWAWTAPANGTAKLSCDQPASAFAVYSGEESAGRLRTVLGPTTGSGQFEVVGGQTYQILLSDRSPPSAPSRSGVHLEFAARPPNDNFANRIILEGVEVDTNGSTRTATRENGEPRHNQLAFGRSVWYSWTAPASGLVRLKVVGDQVPLLSQVYVGDVLEDLQEVPLLQINDAPLPGVFFVEAGVDYKIAVDGGLLHGRVVWNGPFRLNLDSSGLTLLSPTNNTDFVGPPTIELAVADLAPDLDGNLTGVTFFAQNQITGEESALGTISGSSGSLTWANPPAGRFVLYAQGTNGQGRTIMSNPVGVAIRPSNDDFANRSMLEGTNLTWNLDFAAATRESKDPRVARVLHDKSNGATLWWTWTAPAGGTASLSCDQPTIAFAVFSGEAPGRLRTVLSPTTGSGRFKAVGGQTYQILFSDRSPPAAPSRGKVVLSL